MFGKIEDTLIYMLIFFGLANFQSVIGIYSNDNDVELREESRLGTVVQNAAEFIKAQQYSNSKAKYQILGNGDFANKFKIDENSAILTVNGRIDREELCPKSDHTSDNRYPIYEKHCIKKLGILVSNNGNNPSKITLRIKITDDNDHAPKWKVPVLNEKFVETFDSTNHNTAPIALQKAEDHDVGENGRLEYYLKDSPYGGSTIPFKTEMKDNNLYLVPTTTLDREQVANYSFYLYASDNGNPRRTGSVLVRIKIEDINDQTPTFNESIYHYKGNLPESSPVGMLILQLYATDKDSGEHGRVVYEMSNTASKMTKKYFEVHPDGRITVRHKLDYDHDSNANIFKFDVIARDSANHPYQRSSTAKVEIKIGDENDEKPKLTMTFISKTKDENLPSIMESKSNIVVGYLSVHDPDFGGNDKIKCQRNNTNFELTSTNHNEYKLETFKEFDREESKYQYVEITCTDSAHNKDTQTFKIKIEDVNDNAPEFLRQFHFEVKENNTINYRIPNAIVKAEDKDEGINSELEYHIAPESSTNFSIDSRTGQLIANIKFDREVLDRYIIKVLATDKGHPHKTGTGTVQLTITDVNDNSPEFQHDSYNFKVNESDHSPIYIGQVKATDKDINDNQNVIYYIRDEDHIFTINKENGEIRAITSLDREKKAMHIFYVTAKNQEPMFGYPINSVATATVTVHVLDRNDQNPIFLMPNATKSNFEINHDALLGTPIFKALTIDKDEGANGRVSYWFENHKHMNEYFTVDQESGGVYLSKTLNEKPMRPITFRLKACDNGKEPRCTESVTVRISVTNKKGIVGTPQPGDPIGGSKEPIIIGLAVIFIILVGASVILLCLIRRKSFWIKKNQKHSVSQSEHGHDISLHGDHIKRDPNLSYEVDSLLVKQRGYMGSLDHLDSDNPKKKQLYTTQISGMTTSTMLRRGSEQGMTMPERAASPDYQTLDNLQATYRARQLQAQYSLGGPRAQIIIPDSSHTYYEIKNDDGSGNAMSLNSRPLTHTLGRVPRPPPRAEYGTHVFRPIPSISQEKEAMLQNANEFGDSGAYPVGELMQSNAYQFETAMRTLDRPSKQGKYTYDAYKEASFV